MELTKKSKGLLLSIYRNNKKCDNNSIYREETLKQELNIPLSDNEISHSILELLEKELIKSDILGDIEITSKGIIYGESIIPKHIKSLSDLGKFILSLFI